MNEGTLGAMSGYVGESARTSSVGEYPRLVTIPSMSSEGVQKTALTDGPSQLAGACVAQTLVAVLGGSRKSAGVLGLPMNRTIYVPAGVGAPVVGAGVGSVGLADGAAVGCVGLADGEAVGSVGLADGEALGLADRELPGAAVGELLGLAAGEAVGLVDG